MSCSLRSVRLHVAARQMCDDVAQEGLHYIESENDKKDASAIGELRLHRIADAT